MPASAPSSRQSKIHFVADLDNALSASPRPRRISAPPYMPPTRKFHPFAPTIPSTESDLALTAFSDEYDLYPRILQDVQRALNLKAKREALRHKNRTSSSTTDPFFPSSISSGHLRQGIGAVPFSPVNAASVNSSDIDFGPSVGSSNSPLGGHPLPSSSDNGVTLDWSGVGSDGERKWTLSVRRKGKGSMPHLNILVQEQEKLHLERLGTIQKQANRSTLQKASITKEQLARRYNLLNYPVPSQPQPLRLTDVARWCQSQEPEFQAALEEEEPPTWLKHLQKKRKTSARSPWQLTAKITEEYVRALGRPKIMSPVIADPRIDSPSRRPHSLLGTNPFSFTSRGSSHISFDPSVSRRVSYEGPPSFEPLTGSARESLDIISRRSGESGYSSGGGTSYNAPDTAVPNGRRWPESLPARLIKRQTHEHDRITSAQNSLSELSELDVAGNNSADQRREGASMEPQARLTTTPEFGLHVGSQRSEVDGGVLPDATNNQSYSQPADAANAGVTSMGRQPRRLAPWIENKQRKAVNQEKLRREYEIKAHLLEEATAQNHRIRQLLNRVSIVAKEYEAAQANALAPLGDRYQLQRLPRELLEVFSHDPAAVTGPTRRLQGYKAVDDIHNRLVRQRTICRGFLSRHTTSPTIGVGSILRDPAMALNTSLASLRQTMDQIRLRAKEVGELLKKMQDIHAKVKANYNDTLRHTCVVYPELSMIVALEESYKDQYQQFWEIGMDALTFILDSVTPFWRTYGKTIGEDIRDFLIIPLYRNEFTGEVKRYPITSVPGRSLQHWLALCLLYLSTIIITFVSARVAVTLVTHGGLRYIPYEGIRWTALPFFWIMIGISWTIVLTLSVILSLEMVVLLWWTGWLIKIFT